MTPSLFAWTHKGSPWPRPCLSFWLSSITPCFAAHSYNIRFLSIPWRHQPYSLCRGFTLVDSCLESFSPIIQGVALAHYLGFWSKVTFSEAFPNHSGENKPNIPMPTCYFLASYFILFLHSFRRVHHWCFLTYRGFLALDRVTLLISLPSFYSLLHRASVLPDWWA